MKRSASFRGREAEPGIQKMRPANPWIPGSALAGSPGMTPLEFLIRFPLDPIKALRHRLALDAVEALADG